MRQALLALMLIVAPVLVFAGFTKYQSGASAAEAVLGDLSVLKTIVVDVQTIAKSGDLVAAKKRITDFETEWDDAEKKMRPMNKVAWGNVDEAADNALSALRADQPQSGKVSDTLAALEQRLDSPLSEAGSGSDQAQVMVGGIAITGADGRYTPCEDMVSQLRDGETAATLASDAKTAVDALLSKAMERCNADDDQHADEFSAQGLALLNP